MQALPDLAAQLFRTDYATLSAAAGPPDETLLPIYVALRIFDAALSTPPAPATASDKDLVVQLLTKMEAQGAIDDLVAALGQWLADNGSLKGARPGGQAGVTCL